MNSAKEKNSLISGAIYRPMMTFMLPVMAATFFAGNVCRGGFVGNRTFCIHRCNGHTERHRGGWNRRHDYDIDYVCHSGSDHGNHRHFGQIHWSKGQRRRDPDCGLCHLHFCRYGGMPDGDHGSRHTLFCRMDECTGCGTDDFVSQDLRRRSHLYHCIQWNQRPL